MRMPRERGSTWLITATLFDSVEAFQKAFAPHADSIMGDIPNYTDIQPIIQLNEVKM